MIYDEHYIKMIQTHDIGFATEAEKDKLLAVLRLAQSLAMSQKNYVMRIVCELCYESMLDKTSFIMIYRQALWAEHYHVPSLIFTITSADTLIELRQQLASSVMAEAVIDFLQASYGEYVEQLDHPDKFYQDYHLPEAQYNGVRTATHNKQGYMLTQLDAATEAFVEYSGQIAEDGGEVLEIGTAYGISTLAALARGATVYANDMDPYHLAVLSKRHREMNKGQLCTLAAKFPEELLFSSGKFDAILIARVLHFFEGEAMVAALRETRRWLKPDGKLFVTAETPYLGNWQAFLPEYHARKARQEKWPGVLRDVRRYEHVCSEEMPDMIHFMDADTLAMAMQEAGFSANDLVINYMSREGQFPEHVLMPTEKRESVACVATCAVHE